MQKMKLLEQAVCIIFSSSQLRVRGIQAIQGMIGGRSSIPKQNIEQPKGFDSGKVQEKPAQTEPKLKP